MQQNVSYAKRQKKTAHTLGAVKRHIKQLLTASWLKIKNPAAPAVTREAKKIGVAEFRSEDEARLPD